MLLCCDVWTLTFVVILDVCWGKIYEKVSRAAYPKSKIRNIGASASRAKPEVDDKEFIGGHMTTRMFRIPTTRASAFSQTINSLFLSHGNVYI
jgi:hypothetical protein